jgi:acyl-CoA dehydrogenase
VSGGAALSPADLADLTARVRRFVESEVVPSERIGEHVSAETRRALQDAARAAGVFAPHVAVEHGGLGLPLEQWSPVFQAAGYSPLGPLALNCMAPDEGNMHLIAEVGTDAQKEKYLKPLAGGRTRSSFAMTEPRPGAGSDPAALTTVAHKRDGRWHLTGQKRFISGADGAGFAIVMARTPETDGAAAGATMFLVDLPADAFTVGRHIPTIDRAIIGGHPHVDIHDLVVGEESVLGEVGLGFRYAQVRLGPARLTHCMRWLGLARRSLDIALAQIADRTLFGQPQQELGLSQALIADSVIDIETSDAIIDRAAHALVRDPRGGATLSSVAKVYVSEAVCRVIDRCMQLAGGDGMSDDLPLASFYNEVRPFRVYDGSTETQKWAISRRTVKGWRGDGRARPAGAP